MVARAPGRRGRFIAYWFVGMLLMSVVPGFIPTVQAGHSVTVQQVNALVTDAHDSTINTVVNNSRVTFTVQGSFVQCPAEGVSGSPYDPQLTVTVESGPLFLPAAPIDLTVVTSGTSFTATGTATAITSSLGINGVHEFKATAVATCNSGHPDIPDVDDRTKTSERDSGEVPVRLKPPQVTFVVKPDYSTSEGHVAGVSEAGIGATIHVWMNITDLSAFTGPLPGGGSPAKIVFDGSELNFNAAQMLPHQQNLFDFTFPINATPTFPDGSRSVHLTVKDNAENYWNVTRSITADVNRPSTAFDSAKVRVEERAGEPNIYVNSTWTTSDSDIVGARVDVNGFTRGRAVDETTFVSAPKSDSVSIALRPIDQAGNVGTVATTVVPLDVSVSRTYSGVTTGFAGSAAAPVPIPQRGVGNLVADVTAGDILSGTDHAYIVLNRTSKGFWNGGGETSDSNYIENARPFHGTISAGIITFNALAGKNFPDGLYYVNLTVNGTSGTLHNWTYFKVDTSAPTIDQTSLQAASRAAHAGDGNPVHVRLRIQEVRDDDRDVGIANVTVELLREGTAQVATNIFGQPARTDILATRPAGFNATDGVNLSVPLTHTEFNGFLNVTFPNMTVGDYRVRVLATDLAGNSRAVTFTAATDLFRIVPRAAVKENQNTPFLHPGGLQLTALAAYEDNGPSTTVCPEVDRCRVSRVTFFGRVLGSTGDGTELATLTAPRSGNEGGYHNYTPTSLVGLNGLSPNSPLEVRVLASVQKDGTWFNHTTGWTRVKSLTGSTLTINKPTTDWVINTTTSLVLNASFDTRVEPDDLKVEYTIHNLWTGVEGSPVALDKSKMGPKHLPNPLVKNFTAEIGSLAPGDYRLVLRAYEELAGGSFSLLDLRERYFAVAPAPQVLVGNDQSDARVRPKGSNPLTDGFVVARSFNLSVAVEHGAANLTDAGSLAFRLQRGEILGGQSEFLTPGQAGFDVTVLNHSAFDHRVNRTFLNLTVRLPNDALDTQPFRLNVSATTDAADVVGTPYSKHTGVVHVPLTIDALPPVAAMDTHPMTGVNTTGLSGGHPGLDGADHLNIVFGPASDSASGISRVDVRLRDLTANRTWWNGSQAWEGGFVDGRWAPAQVVTNSDTQSTWWRFGTSALKTEMENNPFNLYQVDIVAFDNVGNAANLRSYTFTFDGQAPQVTNFVMRFDDNYKRVELRGKTLPSTSGDTPPTNPPFVSYKGISNGTLVAKGVVTDDVCLASVYLVFEMPSGHVERAPLRTVDKAACTAQTKVFDFNNAGAGSTKVAFPSYALNESVDANVPVEEGVYKAYLQVVDHSGKVTNSTDRYWFRVIDDHSARLLNSYFVPSTAGSGGFATLYANVSENHRMGYVAVRFFRHDGEGTYDPTAPVGFGNMTPTEGVAANGSGLWSITTRDMNVSLAIGSYTAQVLVRDHARHGSGVCEFVDGPDDTFQSGSDCTGVLLIVREGAPPVVEIRSPSRSAPYVDATPRFHAVVYSTSMSASGIVLRTGDNASNLTTVTPEVVAEVVDNRTGAYHVYYNATVPANQSVFVFNLTATDVTGISDADGFSVTVDAAPPTISGDWSSKRIVGTTTWVSGSSKFVVNATDSVSGVASVLCSVNEAQHRDCKDGLTLSGADGPYLVNYTAVDRAGNRATEVNVAAILDKTAPTVSVSKNEADLVVLVEDSGIGVDEGNVTVHYSTTPRAEAPTDYVAVKMTKVTDNSYRAALPADAEIVRYHVEALDLLGNVGGKFTPSDPGTVGEDPVGENRAPSLTVTAPASGSTQKGVVDVRWSASDPDGDNVTLALSYTRADGTGGVVAADQAAAAGLFRWDTTSLGDGAYRLTVRATDGTAVTERFVNFTVRNVEVVHVATPPREKVQTGEAVSFAVNVNSTKAVKEVRAELVRSGEVVGAPRTLTRTEDGAYADSFSPTDAGRYSVRVVVEYEDGTTEPPFTVGTFEVESVSITELPTWTMQFVALIVLSVTTIALAAYAAFGRWKP